MICQRPITVSMFQSTLPTRGSDHAALTADHKLGVSIHAPHEGERRSPRRSASPALRCFNPRSPRGGATYQYAYGLYADKVFQSTLPTRGSDAVRVRASTFGMCFNPRSPRGGATPVGREQQVLHDVSIHAPHEGERPNYLAGIARDIVFQSTLPTRGSDDLSGIVTDGSSRFQSTLPTRGSDNRFCAYHHAPTCFNPRSPRGGATTVTGTLSAGGIVSIHAPHEGERPSRPATA